MQTRALTLALVTLAVAGLGVFGGGCTSQTAISIRAAETKDAGLEGPGNGGADAPPSGDALGDQPRDPVADNAAPERGPDATPEPGPEPAPEPGPEPGPDAGADAGRDAAADVKPDLAPEAPVDTRIVLDSGAVLFSDSFDDGYEAHWTTVDSADGPVKDGRDGVTPMVTLTAIDAADSRLKCNLDGNLFTATNISASMKVRIEDAPKSTRVVRLTVRQSKDSANIFYAVGVTVEIDGSMTRVSAFKKVPDNSNNYAEVELVQGPKFTQPVPMGTWATIHVTVSGSSGVKIVAAVEGQPSVSYADDCKTALTATDKTTVPNGGCLADQTGLGIDVEKTIKASVDDVLVTSP